MKRNELEKYLGKKVEIKIFDGSVYKGELHKTREEKFKNEPNLYIPLNYYFLTNPNSNFKIELNSCLFKCNHIKRIKLIEQEG